MGKVSRVHHSRHHHSHHKDVKKSKSRVVKGNDLSIQHTATDSKVSRAAQLVIRAREWVSEGHAKHIIKKYGEDKLERMLMACENITKLSDDIGLTKGELFKIAKYIEVKLKYKTKKGKAYLRSGKTGLARTIEYKSKRAFIHLNQELGEGCHKKVTKSIMYAAHSPEIVANCTGDKTVKFEGKILTQLHGAEGVAKTYAVTSHKSKHGKKIYSIITKLYNASTLRSYEYNRNKLEPHEEVYVARDLMKGLENMHANKLAHRDLHSGNFMVHKEVVDGKPKISSVLIDFGQVVSFHKAKKMLPRVEVSRHLVTPESLVKAKHRPDIRKIEAFAVGFCLYHLFFGQAPEWGEKMRQKNVKKMSRKKKAHLSKELANDIRETLDKRMRDLDGHDTKYKGLGLAILGLLDPDPKLRFAPHTARKMLEELIRSMEK